MCLSNITKGKKLKNRIKYKVVAKPYSTPFFSSTDWVSPIQFTKFTKGVWKTSTSTHDILSGECILKKGNPYFSTYRTGFHLFNTLKDAKRWCSRNEYVVRCEYKNEIVHGIQKMMDGSAATRNLKVIVVKDICIIDEDPVYHSEPPNVTQV